MIFFSIMMKKWLLHKNIPISKLECRNHALFKTKIAKIRAMTCYDQNGLKTISLGSTLPPGEKPGVCLFVRKPNRTSFSTGHFQINGKTWKVIRNQYNLENIRKFFKARSFLSVE